MNYDFPFKIQGQNCNMTMTSVMGHLKRLDFPHPYSKWGHGAPIGLFDAPIERSIHPDMVTVAKNLELEAKNAGMLIIWTDCDREGEHIGSQVAEICRKSNPRIEVKRGKFSSVQYREIMLAMERLVELDMKQADAVDARMELDLRLGAAFTRFQTLYFQSKFQELQSKVISYGSCQFPTLGFVVEQYWRRERFIPEKFWKISASLTKDGKEAKFLWDRDALFDKMSCLVLYEQCIDNPMATITSVRRKPTKKYRPLPLTTVELQKFGSSRLKISSHLMMNIAEELYNKGYISYPRTETDQFDKGFKLNDIIQTQTSSPVWGSYARELLDGKFKWPRKGKKNDQAHPPIHPTKYIDSLSGDHKRVYEFVVRRFLACCSDDALGQQTTVKMKIHTQSFHTSGIQVTAKNFLEIYPYEKWSESFLPEFSEGEQIMPSACEMHEGSTSKPSLLTEADLIATMDSNGIGTDATIAEHIKKIQDREYVYKEGKYFVPTLLGLALVEGYDNIGFQTSLAKPHLRREFEKMMKGICNSEKTKQYVIARNLQLYREMFVKANDQVVKLENAMHKYFRSRGNNSARA